MVNTPLLFGALFVLGLVVCAVFAPLIAPFDPLIPNIQFRGGEMIGPPYPPGTGGMFLGSDYLGRDLLTRLIYGSRYTLLFAGFTALLRLLIGAALGLISGWYRGAGRLIDAVAASWASVPGLVFGLVVVTTIPQEGTLASALATAVALSCTGWSEIAARTRVEVRALRSRPFIEAAAAIGRSPGAILWWHMLPNLRRMLITEGVYAMAATLLLIAEMGFLRVFIGGTEYLRDVDKLYVEPHYAEWGNMIALSLTWRDAAPWMLWCTVLVFTLTILAFNMLAEGLRRQR
jgi:peptide/nickel transport system permease protein